MIAVLRGKVIGKLGDAVILETNGIGFKVTVLGREINKLFLNSEAVLFTSLLIREDGWFLYGFEDEETRQLFDLLLSVSGIGPKAALAILNEFRPSELKQIIATKNEKALTRVSGIGQKNAQRLFLELKDKIEGVVTTGDYFEEENDFADIWNDVQQGLINLGVSAAEARELIRKVDKKGIKTPEEGLAFALKFLNK
ncbi:Holliday junction branch migration protein RuvA [Carboxydothermus pertinax]|uniref:Holliday junction branch migration complex subunit RuvA n=1 Tax=Carboxydothermus pertinax TaxID=870242 RepID=A0A1L8CXV4_9THEO|nr:Holliday junction branch migration protein RuvA [Carboxydothermus pertinax]GAV23765.1 Holliday junction ATP-dependent DNA helicase RuvA [Carboxydothermus pertinax]